MISIFPNWFVSIFHSVAIAGLILQTPPPPITSSFHPTLRGVFNGTTSVVDLGNNFQPQPTQRFSFLYWYRTTITNGNPIWSSQHNGGAGAVGGIYIGFLAGGPFINFGRSEVNSFIENLYTSAVSSDGNPHALLVTYDGSSTGAGLLAYLDATPLVFATVSDTLNGTITYQQTSRIGGDDAGDFLAGSASQIGLWMGTTLTSSDATATYHGGSPIDLSAYPTPPDSFIQLNGNTVDTMGFITPVGTAITYASPVP